MDRRLIVALDTPERTRALDLVEVLLPAVATFKVGLELFSAQGPAVVREIASAGAQVFLDLKLHDIPNTVAGAVTSACALPGVSIMTVHVSGGAAMLAAAVAAARNARSESFQGLVPGAQRPAVVGVTVLTSIDDEDLRQCGVPSVAAEQVARLGRLARESGLDGLVCSPREVSGLREALGPDVLLVTPGIRPAGSARGDQKRVATPEQALADGASHLVVGRPITAAQDPLGAARSILASLP